MYNKYNNCGNTEDYEDECYDTKDLKGNNQSGFGLSFCLNFSFCISGNLGANVLDSVPMSVKSDNPEEVESFLNTIWQILKNATANKK